MVMKAENFCALAVFAAPFGIAQTSVRSRPSFHTGATFAPVCWMA